MKHYALRCPLLLALLSAVAMGSVGIVKRARAEAAGGGPRTPEEEQGVLHLADPDLVIELVAAEPTVDSPVALAWNADGRMYVAQMRDYPLGPPGGSIVLLEDRDGDGAYETSQVFAEGLSFPNGVLPVSAGVLVTAAPHVLLLVDSDGDGRADQRHVVFSGFGEGNQQLRANGLLWGLDNWIYGANGRSDGLVSLGNATQINLRGRDFRFTADFARFESLPGQSQFGNARDDWGNRFLSWNTVVIRQAMFDDSALAGNPRLAVRAVYDLADPEDMGQVYPRSPRPTTFNAERTDYYNALAGLTIYRGPALGPAYQGNAFVGESLSNLVHRRVLHPEGPTFVSRRADADCEFLASEDPWFHPVFLATGPDGCLYVADFYRRWVEHPQFVADAAKRSEVDWREGAGHGRIWRIRRRDYVPRGSEPLQEATSDRLVALLADRNGWVRDTAQRLLVERRDASAWPPLRALLHRGPEAVSRLHALYVLAGGGALRESDLIAAMGDEHPQLRRHALRLARAWMAQQQAAAAGSNVEPHAGDGTLAEALRERIVQEQEPLVRFELAQALAVLPHTERLDALDTLVASAANEPWTLAAATASAGELAWPLLDELLSREPVWLKAPAPAQLEFLFELGMLAGKPGENSPRSKQLARLAVQPGCEAARAAVFAGLVEGWQAGGLRLREPGGTAQAFTSELRAIAAMALALALDETAPTKARLLAVKAAGAAADTHALAAVSALLMPGVPEALQAEAAAVLCTAADDALAASLFDGWQQWGIAARAALPTAALRSPVARDALLAALEGQRLHPQELDANVRQALLRTLEGPAAARAEALLAPASPADRLAVLAEYRASLELPADARRGARVFREHCLGCHAVQGLGRRVGPDLSGIGARGKQNLLVDVLDPSREVAPNYLAYTLVTEDGRVYTGLLAAETSQTVTLRRAEAAEDTIARDQIEELAASGKSLMPEGLEQKLSPQQVADLLEFLTRPDRTLLEP